MIGYSAQVQHHFRRTVSCGDASKYKPDLTGADVTSTSRVLKCAQGSSSRMEAFSGAISSLAINVCVDGV